MITLPHKYYITVSPDPGLWVRKEKNIYKRLMFDVRKCIMMKVIQKYLDSSAISEYFLDAKYELSTKNKNFHMHGTLMTSQPLDKVEFVQVVGANLQHPSKFNPEVCVDIMEEWIVKEESEFKSWDDYINKNQENPPVPPQIYYNNKNIPPKVINQVLYALSLRKNINRYYTALEDIKKIHRDKIHINFLNNSLEEYVKKLFNF